MNFDGVVDTPLLTLDPFFDGVLDAGLYFIGIVHENTTVAVDNMGGISIANDNLPRTGEYRVHVSVEDHPLSVGVSGNQSLFFPRSPSAVGQLVSESFDLTGYSADDQPNLYFNYLSATGFTDTASYTITSDQDPTGVTASDFVNDQLWRQNIVSLKQFAGHTNVTVTFDYTSGVGIDGEGLYLDDFIVGFAERGETVFNAPWRRRRVQLRIRQQWRVPARSPQGDRVRHSQPQFLWVAAVLGSGFRHQRSSFSEHHHRRARWRPDH